MPKKKATKTKRPEAAADERVKALARATLDFVIRNLDGGFDVAIPAVERVLAGLKQAAAKQGK